MKQERESLRFSERLFLADVVATALTAVVIFAKVPETMPRRTPTAHHVPDGGLRTALTDRVFLVFVGLTLLQALLYNQSSTIMPLAMRDDALSPSAYGTVVAMSGLLIVLGQLFVPRLIDGHHKHRVLALAMAVVAVGYTLLAFADRLSVYLGAAVLWTIGGMLAAPPNAEINSELAPLALRGRYQAVFYLVFPAAAFLAPTLGGLGLAHLGGWHWVITGIVGLVAAGLHLLAGPRRERRVAGIRAETAVTQRYERPEVWRRRRRATPIPMRVARTHRRSRSGAVPQRPDATRPQERCARGDRLRSTPLPRTCRLGVPRITLVGGDRSAQD